MVTVVAEVILPQSTPAAKRPPFLFPRIPVARFKKDLKSEKPGACETAPIK